MPSRLTYIDNLRAAMIVLVVMVHAAVTYSGFGDGSIRRTLPHRLTCHPRSSSEYSSRSRRRILCPSCSCSQDILQQRPWKKRGRPSSCWTDSCAWAYRPCFSYSSYSRSACSSQIRGWIWLVFTLKACFLFPFFPGPGLSGSRSRACFFPASKLQSPA
jgi:hypothetical protein